MQITFVPSCFGHCGLRNIKQDVEKGHASTLLGVTTVVSPSGSHVCPPRRSFR